MKKLSVIAFALLALLACNTKNEPAHSGSGSGSDTDTPAPTTVDGQLPGLFSVSPTKKVHFSQGNLQYQDSTNTWRFAENQYDLVSRDNRYFVNVIPGWQDTYGWGTGNNPTLKSQEPSDYPTFIDWGSNPISNGGNKPNLWRTLTNDEWQYLFEGRPNAYDLYETTANIHDMTGLLLLPDDWTTPDSVVGSNIKNGIDISPYIYYTDAEWAIMEAHGAVYLPAAAIFTNSGDYFMSYCYYWTSTPYDKDANYAYNANAGSRSTNSGADEISNDVEDGSISYRHYTFFVRLVR